jgi:tetratricopeptide (TPR) repeat protein
MGYLFFKDPKGLTKSKEADGHTTAAAAQAPRPTVNVSVEMVSSAAKISIGPALSEQINDTEGQLKKAGDDAARLSLQMKLAKEWDDVNQPAPAAFYYRDIAQKKNTFDSWAAAGSHFNDGFNSVQDTVAQPAFVDDAIECYTNALKLQPANLDAKTGLGVAYVNQFSLGIGQDGGPPKGVMLLLDVVRQDPNNINANLNLGKFALTSHQYDKAVQRFKTVIAHKPGVEAYFYLAESYKQLGMKNEAISAYQKSRDLMPDTAFDRRIDEYIKELKN